MKETFEGQLPPDDDSPEYIKKVWREDAEAKARAKEVSNRLRKKPRRGRRGPA